MKFPVVGRREFGAYFASPTGWVLFAVFLLLSGHFFYTDVVYFSLFAPSQPASSLWQLVFLDLRFVTMLVVPAATMRLFSEEMKLGTIELLRSCPLTDAELVAGKFLAAWTFFLLLLVPTAIPPLLLFQFHPFDPAPLFAAYLGLALLGAACVALGMFVSSLTESQTASAMSTFGALVLLWFLTWNEAAVAESFLRHLTALSLFDRFLDFSRGVIDTRHVVFFVSFAALFAWLTTIALAARWSRRTGAQEGSDTAARQRPSFGEFLPVALPAVLALLAFAAVQGLAGRYGARLDLSAERSFSLSRATEEILGRLPREVRATVFYNGADSGRRRELADLFDRFQSASPRFRYRLLDLDRSPGAAGRYGISAYDTGVLETGESLAPLPSLGEAEIGGALLQLLGRTPGPVCFVTGHGGHDPRDRVARGGYGRIAAALEQAHAAVRVVDRLPPGECRVAVLAGPQDLSPDEAAALAAQVRRGAGVLLLVDPPVPETVRAFVRGFGIGAQGVVVDERHRAVAAEGYLVRVPNFDRDTFRNRVDDAALFSLATAVPPAPDAPDAVRVKVLAMSGDSAWSTAGNDPPPPEPPAFGDGADRRGPVPLAAMARPAGVSDSAPAGALIVVGDSDFAANAHVDRGANAQLFTAAVAALAEAPEIAAIRGDAAQRAKPFGIALAAAEARALFWTAEVALPGVCVLAGWIATLRRRRRQGGR